ncbi:MAG: polyphosphate polymerase domain-containing protein [Ruminococcus sp.]|jgi:hypothetical protein|nr:polyphosphate polymerase domain-containing protein [Ruminococcus sp.]
MNPIKKIREFIQSDIPPGRYRHEQKYLLDATQTELLRRRLLPVIKPDKNAGESGVYKIGSLYFDDIWRRSYTQKLMGTSRRAKYRIRAYNDDDSFIRLERKSKFDKLICKQSEAITRQEYDKILSGDYEFLFASDKPFLKEFYFECRSNIMRPRVIVDYDREPYVYSGGDVRITFDMNLRAGTNGYDLFDPDRPVSYCLDRRQTILEVKFTEFLPRFIGEALSEVDAAYTSQSKYVMCCEKYNTAEAEDSSWE